MAQKLLVALEDAFVTFGGKPLFETLNLHISEGDKCCLIGKNGAGKTTLMKLITGQLELDGGKRFVLPGARIGYLAQNVPFSPDETVLEFVLRGLPKKDQNEAKQHLVDMMAAPLALEKEARMGTLSGGQLRRAALAQALLEEPDVLLLDEPTNHLDLGAIEWLEGYLRDYRGALICVSHDRAFLGNISKKVLWLDRGIIRVCPTGYKGFEDWVELLVEQEARELQNLQKKLAAEVDWTQGGVSARRKRNQRRLRELHALRDKVKADKAAYKARLQTIEVEAMTTAQASKIIVEFKDIAKAYGNKHILTEFNMRIFRGDRIGIIGNNGSGKSTFLKLLTGEIEPDKGHIKRGKTIDIRYFDQNRSTLNPKKTLWETLCPQGGDYVFLGKEKERSRHVCGYLKDFLFDPKDARSQVSTLSGGQQNRLLLAKLMADPGNVLILDEPTNDLDMDTLDMLQELLAEYPGTLILVSHDRDFLDRTVTEVLAFEGEGRVQGYMGGYSDYIAAKKPTKTAVLADKSKPKASSAPAKTSGLSGKQKHELEKLPAKIEALEAELEALRMLLLDVEFYTKDPAAFDTSTRRFATAEAELKAAEERWLELEGRRT